MDRTRRIENRLFEIKEEHSTRLSVIASNNSLLKINSPKGSITGIRKHDSSKDHLLGIKNTDSTSSSFSRTSSGSDCQDFTSQTFRYWNRQIGVSSKISSSRVLSPRNKPVKEIMKKQKKVNSPLVDDRNIRKCQIWRFPNEEIERLLLNGKITYRYKTTGYDIFCPACNLFFRKKDDYQGNILQRNFQRNETKFIWWFCNRLNR